MLARGIAWILMSTLVLGSCLLALAQEAGQSEAESSSPMTLESALRLALDDERHAAAFYAAVMKEHGERRPFSNIIHAERRHEAALLAQFERLGLEPPEDPWLDHRFDVPDTFAAACDVSIVAEVQNARLYDELMAATDDQEVLGVFESLRRASIERHLPAFERHGSGWHAVEPDALTDEQRSQWDKAHTARDAMFASLFDELSRAMRDDGPEAAIRVCSLRAPQIARHIGKEHGVEIGRTSWKLRNPANTPPVWARLLVDARTEEPRVLADRSGRLGSLTPIYLGDICLQCHGRSGDLAPGVTGSLARFYPDDQATGFEDGDLRGWFWVEVPAGAGED